MMASPAAAQGGPYGPGGYVFDAASLYHIQGTLRAHRLRPIARPVSSWPYVVVRAVDPDGDVVRVLLNARFGNVVSITPLPPAPVVGERMYRTYEPYPQRPHGPRYGDLRPDLKAEPAPLGPNAALGANGPYGAANPQYRSAPVTSARPPMPRPRPAPATATAKAEAPAGPAAAPAPASTGTVNAGKSPEQAFPPAAPLE
jgi:hypothetical protein